VIPHMQADWSDGTRGTSGVVGSAAPEKTCFVIAPIGDADSDVRKRSDQVLKHVISPAASACGYAAVRADQISEPGLITSQVIQHVVDEPLVIADLTGSNPNVFYELAIRHALRKPLVQIIRSGDVIPFDVAPMRTVQVDIHDLDSVESAKNEIINQIKAVENDPTSVDTPISVSLDLQILRQSENPEARTLADLIAAVSEVRAGLQSIEQRLQSPEAIVPRDYLRWALRGTTGRAASVPPGLLDDLRSFVNRLQATAVESGSDAYDDLREELEAIAGYLELRTSRPTL
jgi:hypothetical protein